MSDNAPQIYRRFVMLKGQPGMQSDQQAWFEQIWMFWPSMGVSFLYSMKPGGPR